MQYPRTLKKLEDLSQKQITDFDFITESESLSYKHKFTEI